MSYNSQTARKVSARNPRGSKIYELFIYLFYAVKNSVLTTNRGRVN